MSAACCHRAIAGILLLIAGYPLNGQCDGGDSKAHNNEYWTISGKVVLPSGGPAQLASVSLTSVDRAVFHAPGIMNAFPATTWMTDSQGSFTIQIPRQIDKTDSDYHPVLSRLFLIAEPHNGTAGAIGPRLSMDTGHDSSDNGWGPAISVSHIREPVMVQLMSPVTLEGLVLDENGKPLSGITFVTYYDLLADTHTGYGGEIRDSSPVSSDAHGRFRFVGLYPRNISLRHEILPENMLWEATEVDGKLHESPIRRLSVSKNRQRMSITIHMKRNGTVKMHGKVTDTIGNPVVNGYVCFGFAYNPTEETWTDSHSWKRGSTDKEGNYEVEVPTPWILWGMASAYSEDQVQGTGNRDAIVTEIQRVKPGKLDFTVPSRK